MRFGLTEKDLNLILETLSDCGEIEKALIFGSRAMGNYSKGSDVDIAVKGAAITPQIISHLNYLLNEEITSPYFFDVVHYEGISNEKLIEHIDKFGEIFYEKA